MTEKEYSGHRQRLRERFLAGEAGAHSDEAILELILTFAIGRKDVKTLAQELIRAFGGLSQVLSAPSDELSKVKGVGQSSVALLKVIDFIRSISVSQKATSSLPKEKSSAQLSLFDGISDKQEGEDSFLKSRNKGMGKKGALRKFQVSNGYLLEFDQLARILHFLLEKRGVKKINRKDIMEETGLADRHVEGLISMGAAMGLIQPGLQILTPTGLLIAGHDIFIEKKGTLEWCHYKGAGSYRNLVWFEIFNHLMAQSPPHTQEKWIEHLRKMLEGAYSEKTITNNLYQEVRFVTDAYLNRNFSKLEILNRSADDRLYRRRHIDFEPLVLTAMIYDFCDSKGRQLLQTNEMSAMPGSPAILFGLDTRTLREQIEMLHEHGWLRYETTHSLDQIRLKPSFSAICFLTAYFEDHEPLRDPKPSKEVV